MPDSRPKLSNVGNSCAHLKGRYQICEGMFLQLLECVHDKQSCLENVALPACLAMLSTSIGYDDVIAGPSRYTLVAFHTAEVVP